MPWVIAIAFFMQSLDGNILNTALPSMAHSLGMLEAFQLTFLSVGILALFAAAIFLQLRRARKSLREPVQEF